MNAEKEYLVSGFSLAKDYYQYTGQNYWLQLMESYEEILNDKYPNWKLEGTGYYITQKGFDYYESLELINKN